MIILGLVEIKWLGTTKAKVEKELRLYGKIGAISLYRKLTGANLHDSYEYVKRLQDGR